MERVAIVTGGGQGIGRSICLGLAARGVAVGIVDIQANLAQETARQVADLGARALPLNVDITDVAQLERMAEQVAGEFGSIDILVNNAGALRRGTVAEMSETDWDLTVRVCLTGTFRTSRAVVPAMIGQGGGRIVSMASVGGLVPYWANAAYGAAKAGVIMLSRALAVDLAEHGIRANSVCPGATATDMLVANAKGDFSRVLQGVPAEFRTGIPTGRLAEPDEQAAMVVFLACDAPDQVTGHTFVVDGGQSMVS